MGGCDNVGGLKCRLLPYLLSLFTLFESGQIEAKSREWYLKVIR